MFIDIAKILVDNGLAVAAAQDGSLKVCTPITSERMAALKVTSEAETGEVIVKSQEAFAEWRRLPAPR